jgi:hypothetical protein
MRREIMKSIISICILLCLTVLASGMAAAQGEWPTSVPAAGPGASLASGQATGQASPLATCPQYGQAATEGTFGTKVNAGDSDEGRPLSQFSLPLGQNFLWITYWDIGSNLGLYDDEDVLYLQCGLSVPRSIHANDIRLTAWGNYPAGSYIKPSDPDMGQIPCMPVPLLPSGIEAGFYYLNVEGGPGYDMGDPVYLKVQSLPNVPALPETGTNDVRITPNAGFPAGTRVSNNDPDAGKILISFAPGTPLLGPIPPLGGPVPSTVIAAPLNVATIKFYNANGNVAPTLPPLNAIYDEGDKVYLDIEPFGIVSPNDIRLF